MNAKTLLGALAMSATMAAGTAMAGVGHSGDHGHEGGASIGQHGTLDQVDRTIEVRMGEMFFDPDQVTVSRGETVRFVVINEGRAVHEFNIGTDAMHDDHAGEMREMMKQKLMTTRKLRHDRMKAMGMMHDDPNSVLLEPGQTAEVIWTFDGDAELVIACNVPGHRQAGMEAALSVISGGS